MSKELQENETSSAFVINWSQSNIPSDTPMNTVLPPAVEQSFSHPVHLDHGKQFSRKILPSRVKRRALAYSKSSPAAHDHLTEKRFWDAVYQSKTNSLFQLISQGVNVCGADSKRRTALHFAATQGNYTLLKVLLENGANPNAKDLNGNTPLHLAACTNQLKIVTLLLEAGSDINAADFSGKTPLDLARSRLRILHGDENVRGEPTIYCKEVRQIIDMIKAYISRLGNMMPEEKQLDDISNLLGNTTTTKEVIVYSFFSTIDVID